MPSSYYDKFVDYQIQSGINDRIYGLYKRTKKFDLPNKKILEVGCGIGALTYLLSKKIKNGRLEAFDPSERSIEYALKHIQHPNVSFTASDILQFSPKKSPFDLLLVFDVLEHIPEDDHSKVFQRISQWMHADSFLLVNLPNPNYILYDQKHQPEQLQELDQPIFLKNLLPKIDEASLELKSFETYSVWVKEDYQFIVVRKKEEFSEQFLSADHNLFQKAISRLNREWRKINHKLPK